MKLKNVYIIDIYGRTWKGFVDDYFYPEDNESGKESIIIKAEGRIIEFEETDISKIKICKAANNEIILFDDTENDTSKYIG